MTIRDLSREQLAADLGYMPTENIIGPGEILELAQVGARTLANWRAGINLAGTGPFPSPVRTLRSGDLFDRAAVCAWLERHRGGKDRQH